MSCKTDVTTDWKSGAGNERPETENREPYCGNVLTAVFRVTISKRLTIRKGKDAEGGLRCRSQIVGTLTKTP